MRSHGSRESGATGASSEGAARGTPGRSQAAQAAVTTVRRLGYVACKVLQALMAAPGYQQRELEQLNNGFKPLCDMLLGFDLEEVTEVDDAL